MPVFPATEAKIGRVIAWTKMFLRPHLNGKKNKTRHPSYGGKPKIGGLQSRVDQAKRRPYLKK
jgi:hypothetical protein